MFHSAQTQSCGFIHGTESSPRSLPEIHQLKKEHEEDSIRSYLRQCLTQESDYHWLMHPFGHATDLDQHRNLVVYSTFPAPFDESDLEVYIETTFDAFSAYLREKIKALYYECLHTPISEDFILADHADGAVSATLIQILSRRHDHHKVEVVIGCVTLTRRPPAGYRFDRLYWDLQEARMKTALRYIFGREALKAMSCE